MASAAAILSSGIIRMSKNQTSSSREFRREKGMMME
jgi:hypothetical protein